MTELLTDQLRLMAKAYPDRVAYRNLGDDTSITFERWEQRSNRLARGLADRAVAKGDRVALLLPAEQILDWIVTYSAIHKLGAVAVPLNNRLSPPEVQGILDHAEATAVVTSAAFGDAVRPLIGSLPSLALVVTVGSPGMEGALDIDAVMADDDSAFQVPLGADDLADIMYTSGTTGLPKGVAVRHRNRPRHRQPAARVAGDRLAPPPPRCLHLRRHQLRLQPDEDGHDAGSTCRASIPPVAGRGRAGAAAHAPSWCRPWRSCSCHDPGSAAPTCPACACCRIGSAPLAPALHRGG